MTCRSRSPSTKGDASFPLAVVIKDGNNVIDTFVSAAGGVTTRTLTLAEGTHLLSVETTDDAGNRSVQSEELVVEIDRTAPADPAAADLLSVADSGTSNTDNLTNKMQPAFTGTVEPNAKVRLLADGEIVGQTVANSDGSWEITSEPLVDGPHSMTLVVEDLAGNINNQQANSLVINVDTVAPQRPTLDLPSVNDSGMMNDDNVTNNPNDVPFTVTVDEGDASFPLAVVIKDGNNVIDTFVSAAGGVTTRTLTLAEGTHLLSVETTDDAGNRSVQSEELVVEIDRTAPPVAATPDLLSVSDSGMFDDDNVTSIQAVALAGEVEPNAKVRVFSGTELVGQGIATSTGSWEITTEPLDDGIHNLSVVLEDVAGNINIASEPLQIEVDSIEPNLPYLDLLTDLGHSDTDNITSDNTPDVSMTSHDENIADHLVLFQDNFKFRIFDRFEGSDEFLIYDSAQDAAEDAVNFAGDMFTANTLILETLAAQFVALNPGGNFAVTAAGELVDGIHNLKLEVEDRAGNISHDFLLDIEIDTVVPTTTIDILASSDSGMFDDDNVTNIQQIAFTGRGEIMNEITLYAQKVNAAGVVFGDLLIIGTGTVGSDLTDVEAGIPGATDNDGLGMWEITAEPLSDGVYDVHALIEDWGGNFSRSETIRLEVDTIEPNTPFLDLNEASDSGRHDDDNITNDNTPTVTLTTHDTNVALHQVLFTDYLKFRVYDRFEESNEILLYDSATDAAVNAVTTAGDMFTSLTMITETLPLLSDGYHNLKLEVEDRAGNISHDFLFDLVIDTQAFQGDVNLHPESDSGVAGFPATMSDRITSNKSPDFFGVAEANNLVTLAIDGTAAATTVAVPLDGDDAFQPPNAPYQGVEGNYGVGTNLNLADGQHSAVATFEDLAGNRISTAPYLFMVDTQGPRVTAVEVNAAGNAYDLFDPKPSDGPTPPVNALVISVFDLPARTANFLYDAVFSATATADGHFQVRGDHNGIIPIQSITYTPQVVAVGQPATGLITLTFADPLPDDRFTLQVSDSLSDVAGNSLDGESNAAEPQGGPSFPSGDGVPGGDFIARFTVDSRPEVATWAQGVVYVDINGNFVWDPEGQDNDFTNRDFVYNIGEVTDAYFAGNFAPALAGSASGFDKIGVYGAFLGTYQFFLDTNDDGVGDHVGTMAYQVNAIPVAGNFNAAHPGDEIGAFDGTYWYLDIDGNNQIDLGERFATNMRGLPIVGDFNGDGNDDLATFNNDTGDIQFNLDVTDGNVSTVNVTATDFFGNFGFSGFGEKPVAGDFNLDGTDDIGLYVPHQEGQLPKQAGEFHFLISDDPTPFPANPRNPAETTPNALFDPFSPTPLGNDFIIQFGDDIALPLFGNFDPPIDNGSGSAGTLTNQANPLDTNVDGKVSALDALVVINALARGDLNASSSPNRVVASLNGYRLDASGDGLITALDALRVINGLADSDSEGQSVRSDGHQPPLAWATAADTFAGTVDDDDDDLLSLLAQDQALLLGNGR